MESLSPALVPIGSTNIGVLPALSSQERYFNERSDDYGYGFGGRDYADSSGDYNWLEYEDLVVEGGGYRQDSISDINWGMTVLANVIKFVSLVMTVAGGVSSNDRNDGYEEAVGSLMMMGGSILRWGADYMLQTTSDTDTAGHDSLDINKIGLAAPDEPILPALTPEELLKKKQIAALVAQMTPQQIAQNQELVKQQVEKEAAAQGLNQAQAIKLLKETLEHNSLPMIEGLQVQDTPQKTPSITQTSGLTSDQIRLKQQIVKDHVLKQAEAQGLKPAQTQLLLAQTLHHNGLPMIGSPGDTLQADGGVLGGLTGGIGNIFAGATNAVGSVFGGGGGATSGTSDDSDVTPGLPKPGTWEHTVALALFKSNQYLNSLFKAPTSGGPTNVNSQQQDGLIDNLASGLGLGGQLADLKIGVGQFAHLASNYINGDPIASDKIGQVEGEKEEDGLLSAIPQAVGQAAFGLLKFVSPPAGVGGTDVAERPGVTYSEVQSGLSPSSTAILGLLGAGAVGSVAYSYAATNGGLEKSATALAQGAADIFGDNNFVANAADMIRRNDIVQAATNAFAAATGNQLVAGDHYDPNTYHDGHDGYDQYGNYDYGLDYTGQYNDQQGYGHQGYEQQQYQTGYADPNDYGYPAYGDSQDYYDRDHTEAEQYYQQLDEYPPRQPSEDVQVGEHEQVSSSVPHPAVAPPHPAVQIPDGVQFYEPEESVPDVPHIIYSDETDPWEYLNNGYSTDHLYRSFSKRDVQEERSCLNLYVSCLQQYSRRRRSRNICRTLCNFR